MKKPISILLSLISIFCIAFALTGCGDETNELNGKFYLLKQTYDKGWLSESDLKSIACCYYDWYNFEENPYEGMFNSTEELSDATQTELKRTYLSQVARVPKGELDRVTINKCYGTYNGNVAVDISSNYVFFNQVVEKEYNVGGIIFKNFWQTKVLVYHTAI